MNLNQGQPVKIPQNSIEPKPAEIRVVEWYSSNRDKRGVALIARELINGEYAELYADGRVIYKNRLGRIEKEDKVDFNLLEEKVKLYKQKKFCIIKISSLLKNSSEVKSNE